MGEVKEVVDAVLFLTDATFTTGEILHLDGDRCSYGHRYAAEQTTTGFRRGKALSTCAPFGWWRL
jgi:hypothetical protein